MDKLKLWYAKRNPRERAMLAVTLASLLAMWALSQWRVSADLSEKKRALTSRLETARAVLGRAPEIEKRYRRMREVFDPSKCVGAISLQVAVEECAKQSGLSLALSAASSKPSGDFDIHSINAACPLASLPMLAKFEAKIKERAPYLSVTKAGYERRDNGNVAASYSISSFEPRK